MYLGAMLCFGDIISPETMTAIVGQNDPFLDSAYHKRIAAKPDIQRQPLPHL
jgi:hypothetical protein